MSEPTRYRVADNQAQLTLGGGVLVVDPAGPLVEYADYASLKAEVERLTKLCQATSPDGFIHIRDINVAKEGKPSV